MNSGKIWEFSALLFIALILNMWEHYLSHWVLLLFFPFEQLHSFKPIHCFIGLICFYSTLQSLQQEQNILIRRHNENFFISPIHYLSYWMNCCKSIYTKMKSLLWDAVCYQMVPFTTSLSLNDWKLYSYSVP